MKPIVKIILGVLGVATVGKLCYEVGRDVGTIETQLQHSMKGDTSESNDIPEEYSEEAAEEKEEEKEEKDESETSSKPEPKTVLGKKLAELKSLSKIKDLFTRSDDTTIGKLLRNPDGAKIEASVVNGEVHINVKPRTPKRE